MIILSTSSSIIIINHDDDKLVATLPFDSIQFMQSNIKGLRDKPGPKR